MFWPRRRPGTHGTHFVSMSGPTVHPFSVVETIRKPHARSISISQENLSRLLKRQKRAARVILNTKLREEITMTLFKKLKLIPFTDELKVNKCCMVSKE